MADDPNPALRAELTAALQVLAPQIRGLHDLAAVSISPDLKAEIATQIAERERRRDLISTVIQWLDGAVQALNALANDGYPALPSAPIPPALFSELQGEETDLDAAVALFTAQQATTLSVSLGEPTAKTQP
jgi:hypothetical protein